MTRSEPLVNLKAVPAAFAEFMVSLKIMWRVIFALMVRESRTRYGKSELGYLWAIIDPLVEMMVLWGIFLLIGRRVPLSVPVPVFLVTGIFPFYFWRESVGRGATAASANLPLLTYPQVKVADTIVARVILEGATTLVVLNIFIFGLVAFYGQSVRTFYDEPGPLLGAYAALFFISLGTSFFSAGLTRLFPSWPEIWGFMGRPIWIMSGVFYTLGSLGAGIRQYALYNPLAHMLEWMRSAALPGFESNLYSVGFVLWFGIVTLFIGLSLDSLLRVLGHSDEQH